MMSNRLKKDPYADFRSHLVQKALEEKKRMEMEEFKEAVYQNSSLQCCSSDTSTTKSGLGSSNRHSWKKIDETSKIDQIQQSLCSSSKEFIPFSSIEKPTDETNVSHLQPSSIPSPPFLLDHIENEDEFLYGKCDSSPVYQTRTSLLDSYNVCQSPLSKKTAGSSGWSDDDDFLPVQSDCLQPDFAYDPKNDITRGLKFSNTTWKKYEQTESGVAGLSKVGLPFDVSEGNCPEFLKSKFGCNQELNKTQLHVSKSEKKNDFFGLIPSSVSASKPSIPDIASLLKNLKQIQMVQSENVQPEACVYAQRIEDLSDNLAPQTFTPIKNKITLNLKCKNPSSTNDNQVLQTQEDCANKCQVSNTIINQGAYSNQNTAALLVSQFLQKLSTKQGNREIYQNVKCVTKPLSNTDRGSDKNSYQSEPYEKESSSSVFDIKKFEINNLQQSSLTRSCKRSISSDSHILECPKKSKVTESFPQKHWSQSDEKQNSEASKHTKNSLKKEGNVKEGSIHGILKVKAQDLGCEKNYSENSSDANPAGFDRNPREKSYDRCSRRWSRSPRRRSPGESPRKKSPGESPRKRCRSHKRLSPDRSPKRRSRSCKRSHDRSPRKKFFGRSSRHQSCSRRHQSSDGSPEKGLHGRSSQKESHGNSPRRFLQNNTSVFSLGKNSEIRTEVNTVSKHLLPEDSSNRSLCTESFTVLDQKCDKSLHIPKGKKSILGRDTPPILSVPTPESILLEGFLRRKDHSEGIKLDTRKKHSVTPPVISSEIEIKLDSLGSAEILPVYHDKKDSDDKSVHNQFSKRKTVKKLSKREPICTGLKALKPTDSVCSSSDDVTCSQPVQCGSTQLAPSPALAASDLYSEYSGSSVENYQAAYQPSAYSEVVDPSTYSYYMNTLPYTSYSSYGPFSYNMYTSQYPIENHVQQRIGYSDYYTESLGLHKQIPVINPTATLEEKHISKKALSKKDRRKAVLIQVDSSACDTSNKSEEKIKKKDKNESKTEKGDKSASETEKRGSSENKIEKRGKSKSEKIDGSGSKIENEKNHHEQETKRDKNEDKIDMKGTTEGGTEKRGKSKCKTEKEGKREDQSKDNGKAPSEGAETSTEEKELLCRKIEIKKQIENLNSEYVRMSKLQGEMMRKMRREKDGHKDYIITAYGRLQDEIKVQLTDLMTAVRDIDKELEKKVETVKSSTPGTEGEFYKKSHMAENIGKGRFVSTMVEVTPENPEFYDPGGHWCQNCNKLTTSVYDMLLHLKSEEHKEHMDPLDKPWFSKSLKKIRNRNEVDINKSHPVKGVQFVMPVDGFYCSLCKLTFPDSAIAEDHIVGNSHNIAYKLQECTSFVLQFADYGVSFEIACGHL